MTHPAPNRVVILESKSSEVIARNIAKNEADAETLAREITQLDQDISVSALMLRLSLACNKESSYMIHRYVIPKAGDAKIHILKGSFLAVPKPICASES